MERKNDQNELTEPEFEIMDELYFVVSFSELQQAVGLPVAELRESLQKLLERGFVKLLYPDQDTGIAFQEEDFRRDFRKYFYLATKAGLIAHNSR